MNANSKKYYDMDNGKEYSVNPYSKEGKVIIELDSLFDNLKKDGLYDLNKMKYGFLSPELSHDLFLIADNDLEKKEIILDYLMKNIIDPEIKREDIVFVFVRDKKITGSENLKETLFIRTNYYKAISALVKNKVKKIVGSNIDKIDSSTHKEIMKEIDIISNFACFAGEFSKNKESFDTKKRQIISETLKSIFGENTNIIIPRSINQDIKIMTNNNNNNNIEVKEEKKNIDLDNLEKQIFPSKDIFRKFLQDSANKIGTDNVLIARVPENIFLRQNFSTKIASFLKHNKIIKDLGLNDKELIIFSNKLIETDLEGENIIINTIIKKLLKILNGNSSKGLGFYNNLINKILRGNISSDLQKIIEPKIRIDRSREYIQNERELLMKKRSSIDPNLISLYERDVLSPLVRAIREYMSKY